MVMSRSEWDALNSMLPAEDQMSYETYIQYLSADETGMTGDQLVAEGDALAAQAQQQSSSACSGGYVRSGPGTSSGWNCPSGTANVIYWYDECGNIVDEIFVSCVPGQVTPVIPPVTPVIPPVSPVIPPVSPVIPPVSPVVPPVSPVVPPVSPVVPPVSPVVPPVTPPVSPVTPPVTPPPPPPPVVKSATPDLIQFDADTVPDDIILDLLFENIGGQELLTIARNDTVNGQSVLYQPIKNLDLLQQEYNPNNLVKLQDTSDIIFANFPIRLEQKIPDVGNGANATNMYIDSTGSLIIEFVGLNTDELVEVQIAFNGTIYEVNLDDN
jgi:hypothetical protein